MHRARTFYCRLNLVAAPLLIRDSCLAYFRIPLTSCECSSYFAYKQVSNSTRVIYRGSRITKRSE